MHRSGGDLRNSILLFSDIHVLILQAAKLVCFWTGYDLHAWLLYCCCVHIFGRKYTHTAVYVAGFHIVYQ